MEKFLNCFLIYSSVAESSSWSTSQGLQNFQFNNLSISTSDFRLLVLMALNFRSLTSFVYYWILSLSDLSSFILNQILSLLNANTFPIRKLLQDKRFKQINFLNKLRKLRKNFIFYHTFQMGITDSLPSDQSPGLNKIQENKAFYQGECDDQGRHHGRGVMKYSDGSIFEGVFKNGMPEKGKFKYPNGNIYEGQLKDNKPHGQGIWKEQKGIFQGQFQNGNFFKGQIKYSDGSYFKGTMQDLMKSGQNCYYRFKDGDIFEGQFREDHFYNGRYTSKDKDMQYEGFFNKQFQKHGQGNLLLLGVASYVGSFKNDEFQGQGILKNLKTLIKYEGGFKQGKKHGYGKLFGPDDKLVYQGQFINNEKNGKGVFYHQNKRYQGNFIDGKFQGKGFLEYGNGDYYKGEFVNNKKQGKGQLCLSNNLIRSYTGDFFEDKFQGKGEIIYSNRDSYIGSFKNNKKHGKGMYIVQQKKIRFQGEWVDDVKNGYFVEISLKDGTVIKGEYKNGQKDGPFEVTFKNNPAVQKQFWISGKRQYDK